MEEVESYELSLLIKQLKLAVKFPCRLTLQHTGIPISQQIPSNGSNVFTVNKEVNIKEQKQKDFTEINVNLATDKGGNIMAGIIKINLKDIASSQGDNLTVSLQKCLDPYATCLLTVKSVKINRSRVKKGLLDDRKPKYDPSRFQTKSEAMIMDPSKNIKQRPRYNQAESFVQKRVNFSNIQSQGNSNLKEKALSMAGFKGLNTSFDRQQLGTRFKHLNKKDEDNKTVITGKWRDQEQSIKSSLQANQKSLKLEIIKFKTKYEETERNLQQKVKQNKNLKDQISELNRQISEKQYIIEESNSKNIQIAKLEQANKALSKQITEQKNKVIDLQRQIQEQRNGNFMQMSRYKQDHQKKEYEFQKNIYEKKQQIKEIVEENQYKVNQINKMKALIQDLQRSLDVKTYQFEKTYSNERNQHNKTKAAFQQKNTQFSAQIKRLESLNQETSNALKKAEEQLFKLQKRSMYLQQSLLEREKTIEDECLARDKINQQKKRLQKNQEQLNLKLKNLQKTFSEKQKEFDQVNTQLIQLTASSKKKLSQVLEKNKLYTTKIQELQNKVNVLSMQEQKLKRNIDMAQKQIKGLQQNQKVISKNAKLKDDRILQLQKELSDYENKNGMKDGLYKKQMQYKTLQLEKITLRANQLQKMFERQKEVSQQRRLDLLKNENKIKMQQQTNNRLNEQIKQLKLIQIKKDDQWSEKIKQLKDNIKALQSKQVELNKEIHGYQIQKISFKNQIGKFQKLTENNNQKFDRLKKKQSELQAFIKALQHEIEIKNEEIVESEANYKQLQNGYKSLQADKSKTQKITTIISEEKDLVKNDVNRLKKQIQRRQQKEQQYLNDIKNLKQQITKLQIKCSSTAKQYQKFKTSMSQTIKNSLNIKNSFTSIEHFSPSLDRSRDISRSRLKNSRDLSTSFQSGQSKFGETIENFAKQSQQIVMVLNQQLKKVRREKQVIEKQFSNLNTKLKQTEEERSKQIKQVNNEVQVLNDQYASQIEQYEEKVMSLQKQIHQKQRDYTNLLEDYNQLKGIHHNADVASEMSITELQTKINSLKNKITEWERKDQTNSQMFVNLEQKIVMIQSENTELNHQNQVLSDHLTKKQKLCAQYIEKSQDLLEELESVKKIKSELNAQLMSVKENYAVEKESNRQLLLQIKEEQQRNNQLKSINNDFLKEKQLMIKRQSEKTEKINGIQQKIQIYMIELAQKNQQIAKKDKINNENKDLIKTLQIENTNNQNTIVDIKLSLQREKQKIKEKERKIVEKQSQIQNLSSQIKKITVKFEGRIQKLTQQNEILNEQLSKQREQNSIKVNEYQIQLKKLKETEKKLNENNISLEQQIFFEKQTNSLNSAKIDEIKQQMIDINIQKDELANEINNLNQQLRQKEESLFAISGKLYASDNRLQSKEDQFKMRLQKVDLDWRYKIEQICEEYENKLQIMERQKNIARTGVQGYNETVQKLQNDKINLQYEIEKEKQTWELKLKKLEEEKLASLIEKNKQIERIREVFEQLEQKMKRKDFQFKTLEQDKRKCEEKLKQLRAQIEKSQDKKGQKIYGLEKEIDQLKRKEGQLKRFKQALKNNQWATERQIKKNLQLCSKGVAALARQQSKDEVVNLMRNLQASITKLAFENINQL